MTAVSRDRVRTEHLAVALVRCMDARDTRGAEAVMILAGGDLDLVAAGVWRIEARRWCRNPSCDQTCQGRRISGYCRRCYDRWQRHGFPAPGPPEPRRTAGTGAAARFEDYQWLRIEQREPPAAAAARVGVALRTAQTYEQRLRQLTAA